MDNSCAAEGHDVETVSLGKARTAVLCIDCEKFIKSPIEFAPDYVAAFVRLVLEKRAKELKE